MVKVWIISCYVSEGSRRYSSTSVYVLWSCMSQKGTDLFQKHQLALKTGTSQSELSRKLRPLISLCLIVLNLVFHQLFCPLFTPSHIISPFLSLQTSLLYSFFQFCTFFKFLPLYLISFFSSLLYYFSSRITKAPTFFHLSLRHPCHLPLASVQKAQATVNSEMATTTLQKTMGQLVGYCSWQVSQSEMCQSVTAIAIYSLFIKHVCVGLPPTLITISKQFLICGPVYTLGLLGFE